MNIVERPDEIAALQIPDAVAETCRDWDEYTARAGVDQIDSGLAVKV